MFATPLCAPLGIAHPILNAPMAGIATGALAAAVSEAGGFGMIEGTSPGGAAGRPGADRDRPVADRPAVRGGVHLVVPGHGGDGGRRAGAWSQLALI